MSYKIEEETKENELLSPKLDVIFQILFGEKGSENITKDFLSTILDEKIIDISLEPNIVLKKELPEGKLGVVDVLAKINNNEYCNIEMQMTEKKNLIKRILYYWAREYTREIGEAENYINLKRTIIVLIVNFELKSLKELGINSSFVLIEKKKRKVILTEDIEINIIEIPKIYKKVGEKENQKLIEWLSFLEAPDSKEVLSYMESNENMKKAKEKLNEISGDEKVRRIAELRKKAIMDEKDAEYTGYSNGLEEGIKQGKEEGYREGIIKIAKNMKEKKEKIEYIMEITGLGKEEIEKL